MNTKLTLHLNQSIIEGAKYYAKEHKMSLSKLIENYLHSIIRPLLADKMTSPLVESLTGVILDDSVDERKEYRDYITTKYA